MWGKIYCCARVHGWTVDAEKFRLPLQLTVPEKFGGRITVVQKCMLWQLTLEN
jgi:hypothetical protein